MKLRQKLGVLLVLLFLPINGPLWIMGIESSGVEFPLGEFQFLLLSLAILTIGSVMIFAPEMRSRHKP